TAFSFQSTLINNVKGIKYLFPDEYQTMCSTQLHLIHKISGYVNRLHTLVGEMIDARKVANRIEDVPAKAEAYNSTVLPYMGKIREIADKLEMYIDDELWPLPKYRELMFFR
ncbi:MAG: glutamine synthetase type III, partial [Bacteroidales bacterium]|nr:glutamine synthetase type III [Bacteroidales bacterium]